MTRTSAELELMIRHEREMREAAATSHMDVHTLMALALVKADEAMMARLEGMNQFRAQILEERGTFMLRESFDVWVKSNDARREELLEAQRKRDDAHTASIAAINGTIRGYAMVGGVVFGIISLILKFVPAGFGLHIP